MMQNRVPAAAYEFMGSRTPALPQFAGQPAGVVCSAGGPFRAELTFIQMLSMRCVFGWTVLKNLLGHSEPVRLFLLAGLLTVWQVTREHNVEEFIHSVSQRQSRMTVNGSSAQTLCQLFK
ncbi:hypothetical protein QQF64_018940 [Cirrhinus molitorella]|uniref:Uncharacterized protein n=1 Tax=Cirrhinus molitorella TaxID=172907 RepID=A0ABR3LHF4_9TELE